jgi:FkbM family methyltransferase
MRPQLGAVDIVHGREVIRLSAQHARYRPDMERHFETYFRATEPAVENGDWVADFSRPRVHRYRSNGLDFMVSSIPEEPGVVGEYFKHTPRRKLAFDVGAYCGLSTYEASQRFEDVVAFEPDPANRACLLSNVLRHEMANVTVLPAAVAARTGKTRFFAEAALGSRFAVADFAQMPSMEVETVSLTDACALYGVPDFISMDIEAAEIEVLDSSRELLAHERISLAIDTNHEEGSGWTFGPVEKILKACGYQVETARPGGFFTTWGWK